jgi:hypothetical protein
VKEMIQSMEPKLRMIGIGVKKQNKMVDEERRRESRQTNES